jgi:hypothetical protein
VRHLLALCGLIPQSELTRDEVDYVFRRAVENAPEGTAAAREPS